MKSLGSIKGSIFKWFKKLKEKFFNKEKIKNNSFVRFILSSKGIKLFFWIFLIIALIQVVFGVMIYGFKKDDKVTRIVAKIIPYPVAIVNQNVITYNEYLSEKDYIHHFYESTAQEGIDYAAIDKEILNQLIENKLLNYEAFIYKAKVKNEEIDSTLNTIVEQNGGEEKVEKVLDELYGLNIDQFKKLVKTQLIRDKINDKVIMKVTARHILVRIEKDAPAEKVDEANKKIAGYLAEIYNGLDFSEAAKKYSEDTGSAETGGLLEPFASGEMVEEFSKAAFEANPGQIVGPIRTDFGWHIIKVEEKTGQIEKSFSDWLNSVKNKSLIVKFIK